MGEILRQNLLSPVALAVFAAAAIAQVPRPPPTLSRTSEDRLVEPISDPIGAPPSATIVG